MTPLAPPKPKMPMGRAVRMGAVMFVFQALKALCALLVVFAPLFVCYFAKYWVQTQWVASADAGDLACYVAGIGLVASYVVGVSVGIAILGSILSWFVTAIGSLIMYSWFRLSGITFLDKTGARAFIFSTGLLLDFIPYVNVLPFGLASTVLVIRHVRKEDREAQKQYEEALQKQRAEEGRKQGQVTQIATIRERRRLQQEAAANDNEPQEESQAA